MCSALSADGGELGEKWTSSQGGSLDDAAGNCLAIVAPVPQHDPRFRPPRHAGWRNLLPTDGFYRESEPARKKEARAYVRAMFRFLVRFASLAVATVGRNVSGVMVMSWLPRQLSGCSAT